MTSDLEILNARFVAYVDLHFLKLVLKFRNQSAEKILLAKEMQTFSLKNNVMGYKFSTQIPDSAMHWFGGTIVEVVQAREWESSFKVRSTVSFLKNDDKLGESVRVNFYGHEPMGLLVNLEYQNLPTDQEKGIWRTSHFEAKNLSLPTLPFPVPEGDMAVLGELDSVIIQNKVIPADGDYSV